MMHWQLLSASYIDIVTCGFGITHGLNCMCEACQPEEAFKKASNGSSKVCRILQWCSNMHATTTCCSYEVNIIDKQSMSTKEKHAEDQAASQQCTPIATPNSG